MKHEYKAKFKTANKQIQNFRSKSLAFAGKTVNPKNPNSDMEKCKLENALYSTQKKFVNSLLVLQNLTSA